MLGGGDQANSRPEGVAGCKLQEANPKPGLRGLRFRV